MHWNQEGYSGILLIDMAQTIGINGAIERESIIVNSLFRYVRTISYITRANIWCFGLGTFHRWSRTREHQATSGFRRARKIPYASSSGDLEIQSQSARMPAKCQTYRENQHWMPPRAPPDAYQYLADEFTCGLPWGQNRWRTCCNPDYLRSVALLDHPLVPSISSHPIHFKLFVSNNVPTTFHSPIPTLAFTGRRLGIYLESLYTSL